MSETEEKGFEVKDKRRVKLDEEGNVQVGESAEEAPKAEAAEEEAVQAAESDLPPVDVYSMIRYFIGMLNAHSWQKLGLWPDPMTGRVEQDLSQARVAIDAITGLSERLKPVMGEQEARELRDMMSNLQINFVQQSAKKG